MDFTGSAISGVTSLIDTAANFFTTRREGRKAREHSRKMADHTFNQDVEMWKKQNRYNHPAEQMKRFESAGLNPMLMVDKGTPGNAQSMPQYHQPQSEHPIPKLNLQNAISAYQDYQIKTQQISNLQATKEAIEVQTVGRMFDNVVKQEKSLTAPHEGRYQRQLYDAQKRILPYKIQQELDKAGISNLQRTWMRHKLEKMVKDGINIDKDNVIWRGASTLLNDIENALKGLQRSEKNQYREPKSVLDDWIWDEQSQRFIRK